MAYAVIEFVEGDGTVATLYRLQGGEPTGPSGVMDPLSALIEETADQMLAQGSPGALYMAQLFTTRERAAGREVRVLGGDGEMGITQEDARALEGRGYLYEVQFGKAGERTVPSVRQRAIGDVRKTG